MYQDKNPHTYASDALVDALSKMALPTELLPAYHDAHYQALPLQPIEVMQAVLTYSEFIGYLKGNIIKYCLRAGHKQGEGASKDYEKALRYKGWLEQMLTDPTAKVNPRA